jgi:hypothetical protein
MRSLPMLLFAVLLYNILAFAGGLFTSAAHGMDGLMASAIGIRMISGDVWTIRLGDGLVFLSLVLLFADVVRATRSTSVEVMNHALSTLVFAAALVEFIVLRHFSTSSFFLIVAMCLFDVIAGFTISIIAAKRELALAPPEQD